MSTINQTASLRLLPNPWNRLLRILWVFMAIMFVAVIVVSIPGYINRLPTAGHGGSLIVDSSNLAIGMHLAGAIASFSAALLSFALATTIFRQNSHEAMATFLSFYLLLFGLNSGPLEAISSTSQNTALFYLIEGALFGPITIALFLLFPNGRIAIPWTKWILFISVLLVPARIAIETIYIPSLQYSFNWIWILMGFSIYGIAIYAQIYRYKNHSTSLEKQQIKWFLFGISLWLVFILISTFPYLRIHYLPPNSPLPWWVSVNQLIWYSSTIFIPISLSIAIWKYRLYEIDIILNRTLIFGILTSSIVGIYIAAVGLLGYLFQESYSSFVPIISTSVIAILFQPIKNRLQESVNKMMYGDRDNPISILEKLSDHIKSKSSPLYILRGIVKTITQSMKIPYSSIEIAEINYFRIIASYGNKTDNSVTLPISYQTEIIGNLVISPRAINEPFNEIDMSIFGNIASQIGTIVQAAKLTEDLVLSKQKLVSAREEERQRIRRDLHDGLGPTLASQGLKIAAASILLTSNPEKAQILLEELAFQNEASVSDIRKMVYGLRPPSLDELGLVGAINNYKMGMNHDNQVKIDIIHPANGLPTLTASIEVAAYWITLEAITNTIKHANSKHCTVLINAITQSDKKILHLNISDNGEGIPKNHKTGIGLSSMRERAEEIGGTFQLISTIGKGTQILVDLPLRDLDI